MTVRQIVNKHYQLKVEIAQIDVELAQIDVELARLKLQKRLRK